MHRFFLIIICFFVSLCNAQLQNSKWYFGANAGLDFATSPPTLITNANVNTSGGMSSISNAAGNLLFYTDGATVWNSLHQVMANGTGLLGTIGALQNVVITPSATNASIYYIFTSTPFFKTTVDMSLAAGLGSVVTKNQLILNGSIPNVIAGVGCNVVQAFSRYNSSHWEMKTGEVFNGTTYTISSSSFTTQGSYLDKWLKASPNGYLWALIAEKPGSGFGFYTVEIRNRFFLFDPTAYSPPLVLISGTGLGDLFACEFSPDGTKFYVSSPGTKQLYQWDLCAGSNTAIIGSLQTFSTGNTSIYGMQVAPDGKIYCASNPSLSVINSPNLTGASCGFSLQQQSIGNASCGLTLPNFCSGFIQNNLAPLSFSSQSINCTTFSFVPLSPSTFSNCFASAQGLSSVLWNFGDPTSGAANTSTVWSPAHQFTAPGTYTVKLVVRRICQKDSVVQTVGSAGPWPDISLSGNLTICKNGSTIITATGANSYTWSNNTTGSVLTVSPANSSTYSVLGLNSNGCTQLTIFSVNVQPLPVIVLTGNFTICANGSAAINATGANSYTWSNNATGSVLTVSPVNSGTYSVLGVNINNCKSTKVFTVSVVPCTAMNVISSNQVGIIVYPNPSQGVFLVEIKQRMQVSITDLSGRSVYKSQLAIGAHNIDLSKYADGVYLLEAANENGSQVIRLIKE
jgi:hypothetical protein